MLLDNGYVTKTLRGFQKSKRTWYIPNLFHFLTMICSKYFKKDKNTAEEIINSYKNTTDKHRKIKEKSIKKKLKLRE